MNQYHDTLFLSKLGVYRLRRHWVIWSLQSLVLSQSLCNQCSNAKWQISPKWINSSKLTSCSNLLLFFVNPQNNIVMLSSASVMVVSVELVSPSLLVVQIGKVKLHDFLKSYDIRMTISLTCVKSFELDICT